MRIRNVFHILDSPGFDSDDLSVASSEKEDADWNNAETDEQEEVEDEPIANLVPHKRKAPHHGTLHHGRKSRKQMKRVMHDV